MLTSRRTTADAARVYYWLTAGQTFLFCLITTVNMVYQVTVVGLSPLELVLVGTTLELVCFVFEVPTGLLADLKSRRLSVLIGVAGMGAGFTLEGSVPTFWAVIVAQVIWGISYTFTSGATQAWITDEVGEERIAAIFTRETQLGLGATFVGTALAGALGVINVRIPIIVGGLGMVALSLGLATVMPERNFHPVPRTRREGWASMGQSFTAGLRHARTRPVVRVFVLSSLLVGLASEAFDRLWTPHLLNQFPLPSLFGSHSPALWFAVFGLIGTVISLTMSLLLNRVGPEVFASHHPNRLVAVGMGVQAVGMLGVAFAPGMWLLLGSRWLKDAASAVTWPVENAWVNRHIPSEIRATVLSMNGQANAIGQVVGGPPLGAVANRFGIPAALTISAIIWAPTVALFARLRPDQAERAQPSEQPAGNGPSVES
jgi:DHA3 family tetracycline resistance protein-like MFS transporter